MSWNKVFDYFIEIKNTIGGNFNYETPFKDLVEKYGTKKQYNRVKDLQFTQYKTLLLIRYGDYDSIYGGEQENNISYWDLHDGFYRECRSLVIDLENETFVLTPYAKFLNMNETEQDSQENVLKRLENAKVVEFSNKLDGSMISARYYNREYILSTSKSLNSKDSWRLQQAYDYLDDNIKKLLEYNREYTFIFELISKEDMHVVKYDDYGLYLIGIREIKNGNEKTYKTVCDIAKHYNVKTTHIDNITFDEMLKQMEVSRADEKEGWVLNIDGYRVKIKTQDYVLLHKTLSYLSSPNVVIKAVADGNFDDLISKVPESHKERVMDIYKKVIKYKNKIGDDIYSTCEYLYSHYAPNTISNLHKYLTELVKVDNINSIVENNVRRIINGKLDIKDDKNYIILKSHNGKYIKMKEIEVYLWETL